MAKIVACPTRDELILMLTGDLPGEHLESVCNHVEACNQCQQIVNTVDGPPDEFATQLTSLSLADLERARTEMNTEMLEDRASTIYGRLRPTMETEVQNPTLKVPCRLRQYKVLRLIGHGGMGEVYEGHHEKLNRPVALKVIRKGRQDDPVIYEHFLSEMETAGQLEHPSLVRAYDAWEQDGCLFLAQELIEGESLQQLAVQGQIQSAAEIIDALLGICRALEQLHFKGFVHRDVKPGNIMRQTDGTIKLIDYGLAISADSARSASRIGAGTIGYMSPEQAQGGETIDHRSDIYSTGRILKYLLGKLSIQSEQSIGSDSIKKLQLLEALMTRKDREDRLQDMRAVIEQLEQIQQSPMPLETSGRTGDGKADSDDFEFRYGHLKKFKAKGRGFGRLVLAFAIFSGLILGAYQMVFQSDRHATVVIENHQPGDVIRITSENGNMRSVELDGQAKISVAPGTYELSLTATDGRQLNPSRISIVDRDQVLVQVELKSVDSDSGAGSDDLATDAPFTLKMVTIPAGCFVMGGVEGDEEARANEFPQRTIEFARPFRMSTYEITVRQFRQFVRATGYLTEAESSGEGGWKASRISSWGTQNPRLNWSNPGYPLAESLPVTLVTYADANAFCEWLSERDGKKYRLPTEAEWEYASRAGTTTAYSFPVSSRDEYCWSSFNITQTVSPRPVGLRQPNDWGLFDMHGNVREWCLDWYGDEAYQQPFRDAPTGPASGATRVIRGACFMDKDAFMRSCHRGFLEPFQKLNNQGFRIVEVDGT